MNTYQIKAIQNNPELQNLYQKMAFHNRIVVDIIEKHKGSQTESFRKEYWPTADVVLFEYHNGQASKVQVEIEEEWDRMIAIEDEVEKRIRSSIPMKFKINGKAKHLSKEEIRAILVACDSVLSYHNLHPAVDEITVSLSKLKHLPGRTKVGSKVAGRADWKAGKIRVVNRYKFQPMVTLILHEMIHVYCQFPDCTEEKCTSTLTNRLKETVGKVYEVLADNVYQRAAWIAHTKLSYQVGEGEDDFYDDSQYDKKDIKEVKKYRGRKGAQAQSI
tara:strand:+ start:360 stop:1181 length:822 start_codon:yes stop_codon:yes gene_type:complete